MRPLRPACWPIAATCLFAAGFAAATAPPETTKTPASDDQAGAALFRRVMARLVRCEEIRRNYPARFVWPPTYEIAPNSKEQLNAYAARSSTDPVSKKINVRVWVTQGYLSEVVRGDEEVLACVMGHELAHIVKEHVGAPQGDDAVLAAFGRDQEIEADLEGVKIALSAGYSFSERAGVRMAFKNRKLLGDFSNFEGLKANHPSWDERLRLLDRARPTLWKSMAAFRNGVFFLHAEQYRTAENCFRKVTEDFPQCAEAWANLGYARLMRYCDGLEADDIRELGIGQVVAGAFYTRPQSLVPTRGTDEELRLAALQALEQALKLDPHCTLARGNVGLAHLVHARDRTPKDLALALEAFREALAGSDDKADELGRAALRTNEGVAKLASGKPVEAKDAFDAAEKLLRDAKNSKLRYQLEDALTYNRAMIATGESRPEEKAKAFDLLESYLQAASPACVWWPIAYERYAKLARDRKREPQSRETLARRTGTARFRPVSEVKLPDDRRIALGMPAAEILKGIDAAAAIPAFPRSRIKRYGEVGRGVDVLADDAVLAVFLMRDDSPAVAIQPLGIGSAEQRLRVGMKLSECLRILGDVAAETRPVDASGIDYTFFPELGLALRSKDDRVVELVVVQLPRRVG